MLQSDALADGAVNDATDAVAAIRLQMQQRLLGIRRKHHQLRHKVVNQQLLRVFKKPLTH